MRQRFTLAHEYKHIIDHPFEAYGLQGVAEGRQRQTIVHVCDYFAACLLMPKMLLRQAWTAGRSQDIAELARTFGVSSRAMEVRLQDLGLLEARFRCRFVAEPIARRHFRSSVPTRARVRARPLVAGQGVT